MKLSERFPIIARNFSNLKRERTFILIVLLLVFIVTTMSILVYTLIYVFNPQYLSNENLNLGLESHADIPSELRHNGKITFSEYSDKQKMFSDFQNESLDAIIIVQKQRENYQDHLILKIILPEDALKSSYILSILKPLLQNAESRFQYERNALQGAIWLSQIDFYRKPLQNIHLLFESLFSLVFPLMLLIPIFLVGNLFIDQIMQEKEEGNLALVFSSISPKRYIHELLLQALVMNSVLLFIFLFFLKIRFPFMENILLVLLYGIAFTFPIMLLSIFISFLFKKLDIAQLVYTFIILSIFLFSPFFTFSPLYVITELLLGNIFILVPGFFGILIISLLLYIFLKYFIDRDYY